MKKCFLILITLFSIMINGYSQVNTTIEFVVNTDKIIQNENYNNFIERIVEPIKSNTNNVEKIIIIGSASPEGNKNKNIQLANKRADKIYSFFSDFISKDKVFINNDYNLFLSKTGYNKTTGYEKLRAAYIELWFTSEFQPEQVVIPVKDTVYKEIVNNYYYYTEKIITEQECVHNKPVFAVYNDLTSDLLFRANIGAEIYFKKMSFFIEGSFSNWDLIGKTYNIDFWHTGLRKYFNYHYDKFFIEINANGGYFDTDIFGTNGKIGIFYGGGIGIGWVFNLCNHWKLYPIIRFGVFERVYYADYYYSEQGNINISFGNYSNGKLGNNSENNEQITHQTITTSNKTITKEFFNNSNKAYYIGPSYIGLVLKRDFCITKK